MRLKPITNYDRLHRKTPKELAKYLAWLEDERAGADAEDYDENQRISVWLDWLKQEATDES